MHMLTKTRTGLKPGREGLTTTRRRNLAVLPTTSARRPPSLPRSEVTTLRRRPSKGHNCKVIPPPFPSKSETERGLTSVFFDKIRRVTCQSPFDWNSSNTQPNGIEKEGIYLGAPCLVVVQIDWASYFERHFTLGQQKE